MHAWIFSCLLIASNYDKQYLSEVVFSAVIRFSLYTTSTHHRVNHQRVLQGCPLSPTWCCAAQETRVVVNRQLAPPSRQCSSTFLALDSEFLRKTRLVWFPRLLTLLISADITKKKKSESSLLLQTFHHFPYNENPTWALNTTSFKCCLPSNDAIDRRGKTHVCIWRFKVASCKRVSLKTTRFLQQQRNQILFRVVYKQVYRKEKFKMR